MEELVVGLLVVLAGTGGFLARALFGSVFGAVGDTAGCRRSIFHVGLGRFLLKVFPAAL